MPEHATVAVSSSTAPHQRRVTRSFYVGAGLFVIGLAFVGFGPSIVDASRRNAALTALVIAHGIAAGAWLLLFLTQAVLVASRRTALHRRVGLLGPIIALAVIALGYSSVIEGARRGYDLSGDLTRAFTPSGAPALSDTESAAGILPPLSGFLMFAGLVAAGLWYRHRPDVHKRLMLLALIPLAGEPVVHLIGHLAGRWSALQGSAPLFAPIQILFLSTSAIHDKLSTGRIHPVSLWVPIAMFAWLTALNFLVRSVAWQELAVWIVR